MVISVQSESKSDLLFLIASVLLGFAIRFHLLIASHFVIDADEAIVGLMGKHILEGRGIPTFYYGQHYMGSLEALLSAAAFGIFGVSCIALKMVPLFVSLLLIPLFYAFMRNFAGIAAARFGTVLLALPPAALVEWSSKARGGFIEVVFIGTAALLLTVKWLQSEQKSLLGIFWIGLILGIGWWVNNQIVYFITAIGSVFLSAFFGKKGRAAAKKIFVGLLGFFIGGSPYWIYNFYNQFVSFEMLHSASSKDLGQHIYGLFTSALPIILGAKRFWHDEEIFNGSLIFAYAVWVFLASSYFLMCKYSLQSRDLKKFRQELLLLILLLASFGIFTTSAFGYLVQAPRYLLPAYVALFGIAGCALAEWHRRSKLAAYFGFGGLLALHLSSSYLGGLAVPGEPIIYLGERVSRDHSELLHWLSNNQIRYVRTNYWIGYRLTFETKERVKFKLFHEPYQVRVPEYENEVSAQPLSNVPTIVTPLQAQQVRAGLKTLQYEFKERILSSYVVFYDVNAPNFDHRPTVPATELTIETTSNQAQAALMDDDDLGTRWGTGKPQGPGMKVMITLKQPMKLSGLEILLGRWSTDYPRSLRIDVVESNGTVRPLYTPDSIRGIEYFADCRDKILVPLPTEPILGIHVVQMGKDTVFDWSIAELKLFQ